MKNLFSNLNIKEGDILLVSSDILKLMVHNRNLEDKIDINSLIDMLKEKVSTKGTLLFPTFNWDYCKGKVFDYKKTKSECGALSNLALERKDFARTKNPIYSFVATGKDKEYLCEMPHTDCYSFDSPFGYLLNNKAKNLFINLHYRLGGYPFVHVLEQELNLSHRFKKDFSGYCIDKFGKKEQKTFSLFVRKIEKGIGETFIREEFDEILIKNKAITNCSILENIVESSLLDLNLSYKLLKDEYSRNRKIIYSAKI